MCAHRWIPLQCLALTSLLLLIKYLHILQRFPLKSFLPQAEHSQLSQSLFVCQIIQALNCPYSPLLGSLQYVHVLLVLWSPEMDAALQMWPPQCWTEGKITPLFLLATLLLMEPWKLQACLAARAHCWLMFNFHQDPKGLFCKVVFQPVGPSLCWCGELSLLGCRTWHFPLFVNLHEAPISPFLQPLKLRQYSHLVYQPLLSTLYHLQTQSAVCPIIQVLNEGVKQYWTPGVHHQRLASFGTHIADYKPLSPAAKSFQVHLTTHYLVHTYIVSLRET